MELHSIDQRYNKYVPSHSSFPFDSQNLEQKIQIALHALHKVAIMMTAPLPFSSRHILSVAVRSSLRVCSEMKKGQILQKNNESILSLAKRVGVVFLEGIQKQWNQGIRDCYKDLTKKPTTDNEKTKRLAILKRGQQYARLQYCNQDGRYHKNKDAYLSSNRIHQFDSHIQTCFQEIKKHLNALTITEDDQGGFYCQATGTTFNLAFNKEANELVLCFHGLTNEKKLQGSLITPTLRRKLGFLSTSNAAIEWFGGVPSNVLQAIQLGKILKETAQRNNMQAVVIGHSHGGGLAQTAAITNDLQGIVFNSRPMGAGVRRYIGQNIIAKNSKKIVAFSGKGDYLTQNIALNFLGIFVERALGIVVPRSVGIGYTLPQLPKGSNNHKEFDKQIEKAISLCK